MGIFPIRVKIENIWNHHPVIFMIWQNTICLDPVFFSRIQKPCFFLTFIMIFAHIATTPKKTPGENWSSPDDWMYPGTARPTGRPNAEAAEEFWGRKLKWLGRSEIQNRLLQVDNTFIISFKDGDSKDTFR